MTYEMWGIAIGMALMFGFSLQRYRQSAVHEPQADRSTKQRLLRQAARAIRPLAAEAARAGRSARDAAMSSLEVSRKASTVVHAITGGPMPFQPNENHRTRNLLSEYGRADKERAD